MTPEWFRDTIAVCISDMWPGAEIHYTLDGSEPARSSMLYTKPVVVRKTTQVNAIAYREGFVSTVSRATFTLITPILAPVFDTTIPATFTDSVRVSLVAFYGSGKIHFTVDGSTPTRNSPEYTGPFYLKNSSVVKAITGIYNLSEVASRTYTLDGTPRISPDSGLLADQTSVLVTLWSTSPEIRYTLDGSDPSELSSKYTTPLTLSTFPVLIKARAFWAGAVPSAVSSVRYTLTGDGIVIPSKPVSIFSRPFFEGRLTDNRDGKFYRTVTIAGQTWMAENLNYRGTGVCDGVNYGCLYTWDQVMNGANSSRMSPSNVKGICPVGWHIPSDTEWDELMNSVGGSATAGASLKSVNGWENAGNGTNAYGFSALPGGYVTGALFVNPDIQGFWWSATENDALSAWGRNMHYGFAEAVRHNSSKSLGFSLRCLQD